MAAGEAVIAGLESAVDRGTPFIMEYLVRIGGLGRSRNVGTVTVSVKAPHAGVRIAGIAASSAAAGISISIGMSVHSNAARTGLSG